MNISKMLKSKIFSQDNNTKLFVMNLYFIFVCWKTVLCCFIFILFLFHFLFVSNEKRINSMHSFSSMVIEVRTSQNKN